MLGFKILFAMFALVAVSEGSRLTPKPATTTTRLRDRLPTLIEKTQAPRTKRNFTCNNCSTTGVAPGPTRDVLKDPSLTSSTPRGCNFPTVQVPTPRLYSLRLCSIIQQLKANATYAPYLPDYCICRTAVRLLAYSACSRLTDYFPMFYLLRRLEYLDRIRTNSNVRPAVRLVAASLAARLRAMANSQLGNNVFTKLTLAGLIAQLRDDTQLPICKCYDLLVAAAKRLILAADSPKALTSVRNTLTCVLDGDRGFGPLTLVDIVTSAATATPRRIRELCPSKGCCVARVTLERRVSIRQADGSTTTIVDQRNFGGIAGELTEAVCDRYRRAVASAISTCSVNQGFIIARSSRASEFVLGDVFCAATKKVIFRTAVEEYANRIRFAAAMCKENDLLDRSCVGTFVPNAQAADIRNTNRAQVKEAIITAANRLRRFAAAAKETLRVKMSQKNDTVGEVRADRNGTCDVNTTDPSGEGRVDYSAAIGRGAKILSRLRTMIVNQRLDLDDGELEGAAANGGRGEVEVAGVFTAQRGSALSNVIARLRNAAVIKGVLALRRAAKIICEGSILLDNTTVEGNRTANGYELECTGAAVVIAARGKRSVLRAKTKTVTIQIDEGGGIDIEAQTNVRTVITTPNSVLRIRQSSQAVVEDLEGDGELDIDSNSELVLVRSIKRARLILRNRAILRCARNPNDNTTRNASAPADVTSIETDVDVPDGSRLEVIGRSLLLQRRLNLRRAAKLLVAIGRNDALGGNGSAPIVCENFTSEYPRNMSDGVTVEIDAQTLCKYLKRIVLIKFANGMARMPARAIVRLIGSSNCGALGRRRLQSGTTSCDLVTQGNTVIMDCNGSPTTAAPGASTSSTPQNGPATTTSAPGATPGGSSGVRASVVSVLFLVMSSFFLS